jgi:FKBP-type peptidyl-prolyl cis-trans isomerase SlyD
MKIAKDAAVSFNYTLTDETGEVLDSSQGREPLTYLHGHDQIIPGLERQLEGLETGAKVELDVPAAEGYGEHRSDLLYEVERSRFDEEVDLEVGNQVMAQGASEPVVLTINAVSDDTVVLDANHPLAGKDLNFAVEVTEVREATEEELAHGHVHDGSHHH